MVEQLMDGKVDYWDLNLNFSDNSDNLITDGLALFFQEIEIAMLTGPNEIWSIRDSIKLSRYLFNRYVTITQIKNEITTYIVKHCQQSENYQYNISVETINIDGKDLIYVVMTVTVDNEHGQAQDVVQKFLLGSE